MNTSNSSLIVGSIEALVVQKNIKNLHLSVLPPNGLVRITAPIKTKEDVIRVFLASKLEWIKKRQQQYLSQRRQTKRKYVSGETHYYLGRPYRLLVKNNAKQNKFYVKGKNTFILEVKPNTTILQKEKLVTQWYRAGLKRVLYELINKWQPKLKVTPAYWRIQRMKTKWGSCNPKTGRILINLELIKKPYHCVEYVVVHEWLHLLESKHNDHFIKLLNKYLPKWKQAKTELNQFILTYEKWGR